MTLASLVLSMAVMNAWALPQAALPREQVQQIKEALDRRDVEAVDLVFDTRRLDINAPLSDFGMTLLHLATSTDDAVVINHFLERGARIDARSRYGRTPLMSAAERDRKVAIRTLVSTGADVAVASDSGTTALMYSSAHGDGSEDILRLLTGSSQNLNRCDSQGRDALSYAVMRLHVPTVRFLLRSGADRTASKLGALPAAMLRNDGQLDDPSIQGSDWDDKHDSFGYTPFMWACIANNLPAMEQCIARKHRTHLVSGEGYTFVGLCTAHSSLDAILRLKSLGVDLYWETQIEKGDTPFQYAASKNDVEFLRGLLAAEARTSKGNWREQAYLSIGKASWHDAAESVSFLLTRDVDPNAVVWERILPTYEPPLFPAVTMRSVRSAEVLLKAGADPNFRWHGDTPLHAALFMKVMSPRRHEVQQHRQPFSEPACRHLVQLLLDAGADVNSLDDEGMAPLHFAAMNASGGIVTMLLDAGANPWQRNNRGLSPADLAERRKDDDLDKVEVCRILREAMGTKQHVEGEAVGQ
jgi:ankyrin repeat protein